MTYSNFKNVYYNEADQKVWRTNSTAGEVPIRYHYVGAMTLAEYELLIEVLFQIFEDEIIYLKDFEETFGDIRAFCDKIKLMVEDS